MLVRYRHNVKPHVAHSNNTDIQAVEQLAMMPLTKGNSTKLLRVLTHLKSHKTKVNFSRSDCLSVPYLHISESVSGKAVNTLNLL